MKKITYLLRELIDCSKMLGLSEFDFKNAHDFLANGEYGLCFDTVITQLYENDIEINIEFYEIINKIAQMMNIPTSNYIFMLELVRNENHIPHAVSIGVIKLLESLKKIPK